MSVYFIINVFYVFEPEHVLDVESSYILLY